MKVQIYVDDETYEFFWSVMEEIDYVGDIEDFLIEAVGCLKFMRRNDV